MRPRSINGSRLTIGLRLLVVASSGLGATFGCGNSPGDDTNTLAGGAANSGASGGAGGSVTGGAAMTAGAGNGSMHLNGGTSATGGAGSGGTSVAGGGGGPAGGQPAAGGTAMGGMSTGGRVGGGKAGASTAGSSSGGKAGAGDTGASGAAGSGASGAAGAPDCSATMPTGGDTHTGSNVNGMADGLNYGIWSNGSGGSITVFKDAHAFSASWSNSQDFLAHVGLDFNPAKAYTTYGSIIAQFVETKTGSSGGWSSIGIYGWMHSPCIEWYINEDSFNGLGGRGGTMVTIDGATYYLTTSQTNGTGGANACESGHSGAWTNITSTRMSAHSCGTVTVSDHFKAWEAQGWSLGTLASVHINVEVGGGTGSIDFPVANVTTDSK